MTRLGVLLALLASFVVVPIGPAQAACGWVETSTMLDGAINVSTVWQCDGSSLPAPASGGYDDESQPVRDSDLDTVCVRGALTLDEDPFAFCAPDDDEAAPTPTVTPGMIAAAFRRLELPAAQLEVQPPNGRTLVNFATNFYTQQGDLTRTATLLGRQVELRIHPTIYTWSFGDGTTTTTTEPGAPYPALDVTHEYRKHGKVAPSVDTTYGAEFSVDGGPWRPVDGTVTIPGPPVDLRVLTATPTLVGYR